MPDIQNTTTTANTVLVQPGWQIFSRDGEALGEVVAIDGRSMMLRGPGLEAPRYQIPADSIIEQEEAEMRARVSLDAADVAPANEA
jgi:hypothetical protein